jgi:phenylalanyl-tRNA synthetase beta chain
MGRLLAAEPNGYAQDSPELWARLVPNPAGVYKRDALTLPVRLLNPATQDRQVLRLTLLPSLLDVVARNLKHTDERLAFFEVDRTFFDRAEELPYERRTLALVLSGKREPTSWQNPTPPPFFFYDVKGMLAATLDALQVKDWKVKAGRHPALHPGRSAVLQLGGYDVAYFGELHPEVAQAFEIDGWPVQVAEVDLDAVFAASSDVRVFHPLPRFPSAFRDIAVVVEEEVPAAEILRVIRQAGGDLLESTRLFDVYAGDPLPTGTKSIAVAMEFRAPGATLTQEEVSEVMDRIVSALGRELHATLRE